MLQSSACVRMGGESVPSRAISPVTALDSPTSAGIAATVRSALWAAWGDALGFPAELVDAATFRRRTSGTADGLPTAWRRRVGGRLGPQIELPAGAYSDDTQLRLSVGRCIRSGDGFDVEAFSKIELPVFLSYQLGAGRGTRAAAQALGRRGARWYSAFFDRASTRYVDGGGNGAAMRVQPHVWASPTAKPETYLPRVLRDTIATHGHPRAIVGAALHALSLGSTLHRGQLPEPDRWDRMARFLECIVDMPAADSLLAERWLPRWQEESARSWEEGIGEAIAETARQLEIAAHAADDDDGTDSYGRLVADLGGQDATTRGAGNLSAVLSLWIAWQGRADPEGAIRAAARLFGSDTDTIASMAGALIGVIANDDPPGELQDRDLLTREASRLANLSARRGGESFPHPDPLHWQPPASQSDALGLLDGEVCVAGLGPARVVGEPKRGEGKNPGLWQWVETAYGQTLFIKRREQLRKLPDNARPRRRASSERSVGQASLLDDDAVADVAPPSRGAHEERRARNAADQALEPAASANPDVNNRDESSITREAAPSGDDSRRDAAAPLSKQTNASTQRLPDDVDEAVELVVQAKFERVMLSRLLLHLARLEDGPYRAGLFAYKISQVLRRHDGR